jgi:Mrp family chromosome partitioning ATPase
VRAGETFETAAQRALQGFRRVQARVAGAVLNGVEKQRDRYYHYYTYGSRGQDTGPGALRTLRRRLARWF